MRARVGNHGEIPGRELRCVRETELPCGSGLSARGEATRSKRAGERAEAGSWRWAASGGLRGAKGENGVRDGPCRAKRGRGGHGSSWAGPTGEADWGGVGLLSWVGLTLVVWASFPSLLFPLFSIFQPHSNYLNSNSNLNSTLTLNQNKTMHQHECTNKLARK